MSFSSNCHWKSSMLFNSFEHAMQDEPVRQRGNGMVLVESAVFEVRKP